MMNDDERELHQAAAAELLGQPAKTDHSELAGAVGKMYNVALAREGLDLPGVQIVGDRAVLFAALARAQAKYEPIRKTRSVDTGKYVFEYADLDEVLSATLPALNAEGCSLRGIVADSGEKRFLHTLLTHESGAAIAATLVLPDTNDIKAEGGNITYLRRYQAGALTGTAPERDDDNNQGKAQVTARDVQRPQNYREQQQAKKSEDHPHAPPAEQKPGPSKTVAFDSLIREEFLRLGMAKGPRAAILTMEVTGKDVTDKNVKLDEAEQKKLLEHLRGLPTPQKQ